MGEHGTWRTLYEAHFRDVYRLAYALGVPPADVEDITQRVFLVVNDKLSAAPELELRSPRAWLRAITVRVVSDYRRFRLVRRVKRWLVRSTSEAQAAHTNPEEHAVGNETQRQVRAVLDTLSPKLREVLVLTDIEEVPPREVADMIGVPLNTVRSRRRLAREQFCRAWKAATVKDGRDG